MAEGLIIFALVVATGGFIWSLVDLITDETYPPGGWY